MYLLSSPRGIIATDQSRADLEKIQTSWPEEKTHISEWKDPKNRKVSSSRRKRRSEDAPDA